jgi:hypothetical protein
MRTLSRRRWALLLACLLASSLTCYQHHSTEGKASDTRSRPASAMKGRFLHVEAWTVHQQTPLQTQPQTHRSTIRETTTSFIFSTSPSSRLRPIPPSYTAPRLRHEAPALPPRLGPGGRSPSIPRSERPRRAFAHVLDCPARRRVEPGSVDG